jgi:hypothetical protein
VSQASQQDWSDFYAQVDAAALARTDLFERFLPGGHWEGDEYCCGNINGDAGKSFKINRRTGIWVDFASPEKGGRGLISLLARQRGIRMGEAALELGRMLSIVAPRPRSAKDAWTPVVPVPHGVLCEALPLGVPAGAVEPSPEGFVGWLYLDADGQALMYRMRFDVPGKGKDIMPLAYCQHSSGRREWRWRDLPSPRPLYNLETFRSKNGAPVLIVSGEKCVHAAEKVLPDWLITTWPGGDNRVSKNHTDWKPLLERGGTIYIWPDNDTSCKDAALAIADILRTAAPMIVAPDPHWPEGYDIADLVEAGWTEQRVVDFIHGGARRLDANETPAQFRVPVDIAIHDLHVQTERVTDAIKQCNNPPSLFQAAQGLTIVDRDIFGRARARVANEGLLRHWLVGRIAFVKNLSGTHVPTQPNDALLANLILSGSTLPVLQRLTETPVIAADGRTIGAEGFDSATGVCYLPWPKFVFTGGEMEPSLDDAQEALGVIDDLICDFPFVSEVDKTHAIIFAMLPILRMTINGPTPMFRFEAPTPGTGKTLLMRLLARLAGMVIVDIPPCEDDEEWRKRITAAMARDPDVVLIDNAEKLEYVPLKNLLTDDFWEDRQMATHLMVRYQVRAAFGCSLNNPMLSREQMRRSLRVRLDAKCERPEQRSTFKHQTIVEYAAQRRVELVNALITIARYGSVAGKGDEGGPMLGSYEAFCRKLNGVTRALGLKGFLGDRDDLSAESGAELAGRMFVETWAKEAETRIDSGFFARELVGIAERIEGFPLGRSETERGKQTALGSWLSKHRGYVMGSWQILGPFHQASGNMWRVQKVA